jgi:hypothetical protein
LINAQLFGIMACLAMATGLVALVVLFFCWPPAGTTTSAVATTTTRLRNRPKLIRRTWNTARVSYGVALIAVLCTCTMNDNSFCEGDCKIGLGSTLNLCNAILLIVLLVVTSPWYVTDEHPVLPDQTKKPAVAATAPPLTGNDDDLIMLVEEGKNDIPTREEDDDDNRVVPVCLLSPQPLEERIPSSFTPDGTTATHTDSCGSDNDDVFVDCRFGSVEEEEREEMQKQHIVPPQENGKVDEGVCKRDVENAFQKNKEMQHQQQPQVPNDCNNVDDGMENDVADLTDFETPAPPPDVLLDKHLLDEVDPIGIENTAATAVELISCQEQPLFSDAIAADVVSSAPVASGAFAALVGSSTTAPSTKTMTLPTFEYPDVSAALTSSDPSASPPFIALLVDQTVRTQVAVEVAALKAYHVGGVASLRQDLATSEPATPGASRESEPASTGASCEEWVLSESVEEVPTSTMDGGDETELSFSGGEEVFLDLMEPSTVLIGTFEPITTTKDSTDDSSGDEAWESLLEGPSAPGAENSGAAAESEPSSAMNAAGETVSASFQEKPAMICISSSEGSSTGDDSCDELLESSTKAGPSSMMFGCINKTEVAAKQEDGSASLDVLK